MFFSAYGARSAIGNDLKDCGFPAIASLINRWKVETCVIGRAQGSLVPSNASHQVSATDRPTFVNVTPSRPQRFISRSRDAAHRKWRGKQQLKRFFNLGDNWIHLSFQNRSMWT